MVVKFRLKYADGMVDRFSKSRELKVLLWIRSSSAFDSSIKIYMNFIACTSFILYDCSSI